MNRQTFKISGMHCSSCAMTIDMELEELAGVKEARTSFAKATTEVVFDPARVSVEKLVAAIRDAGYEARALA